MAWAAGSGQWARTNRGRPPLNHMQCNTRSVSDRRAREKEPKAHKLIGVLPPPLLDQIRLKTRPDTARPWILAAGREKTRYCTNKKWRSKRVESRGSGWCLQTTKRRHRWEDAREDGQRNTGRTASCAPKTTKRPDGSASAMIPFQNGIGIGTKHLWAIPPGGP